MLYCIHGCFIFLHGMLTTNPIEKSALGASKVKNYNKRQRNMPGVWLWCPPWPPPAGSSARRCPGTPPRGAGQPPPHQTSPPSGGPVQNRAKPNVAWLLKGHSNTIFDLQFLVSIESTWTSGQGNKLFRFWFTFCRVFRILSSKNSNNFGEI